MLEEGKNKLTFQNYHKQIPAHYKIYSNCEALTGRIEEDPTLDPEKSNTRKTQQLEVCNYCYIKVRLPIRQLWYAGMCQHLQYSLWPMQWSAVLAIVLRLL